MGAPQLEVALQVNNKDVAMHMADGRVVRVGLSVNGDGELVLHVHVSGVGTRLRVRNQMENCLDVVAGVDGGD